MRQVLPEDIDDVDPAELYARDQREGGAGRPWVMVNMIASIDGATVVDGVSGPLGGPADKRVFAAIRGVADAILVGAGTVRAERYGPPRPRGDGTRPRLAVVTATGQLDPSLPLFASAPPGEPPPLVLTCAACPPERRAALSTVAEVEVVGEELVDVGLAIGALQARGFEVVLAEGGPSLNGQLIAAGLVDEWCAAISPTLVGGASPRPAIGPPPGGTAVRLRLDRLLLDDDSGLCFARYVRLDSSVISAAKSERSSKPL